MKSEHFSFFLLIWTVPSSFPKTFEVTSIGSDAVKHEHDSRSFRQFTELLPLKNRAGQVPLGIMKSQGNGGFEKTAGVFGPCRCVMGRTVLRWISGKKAIKKAASKDCLKDTGGVAMPFANSPKKAVFMLRPFPSNPPSYHDINRPGQKTPDPF